ncbi:MAG: family intrarane metalloprotease [Massilia sp.]|nr:family intrarane metalloprotease [Massilia sp.]
MSLISQFSLLPWAAGVVCSPQLQAPDIGVCLRLLLLSPALEECVVRAGLQEWLIRRRPAAASPAWPVIASAAAFGLLHIASGWPHALAVTVPGLALAMLYQRTRSWRWCALAHSGMNAFAISVCGF